MSSQKYEPGKLNSILESLLEKKKSGILSLKTQVDRWHNQRSCILIVRNGALVYGDLNVSKIPSNQEICQMLGEKLKPNLINAALSVAIDKVTNSNSITELMELLTRMRVFTWQEAETFIANQVVLILEQFLPNPGQVKWQPSNDFDLSYGEDRHGLDWLYIKQQINLRQQKWAKYAPTIPSMDAIPFVSSEQLAKIGDRNVKQHLMGSADGKNTLLDIADKMGKDPLKVAKSYVTWAENGWINIGTTPQATDNQIVDHAKAKIQSIQNEIRSQDNSTAKGRAIHPGSGENLPIVLSVDDSAIIQISIKRALEQEYKVLLASKAEEALKMLHQNKVELLLLDLTMPDVDGLEFCKTIRKIDKFRELPIVMVTARDGLVNKMKGHIAGSSRYLTKPFQPEQLRQVVGEYIKKP
ncbi:response regulator [Waterburya agarophytonicola K14]|uniref:Response regulator n=1 Tax=Waterburya agarophytonicola KI4 TaxID=2874699 RepID=A0A964FEF7_9CYAN|nr:response regulator [Waterburya agarophytonicola]MCC0176590.1 response regulator [Waterburya agarophytonicola KI4]